MRNRGKTERRGGAAFNKEEQERRKTWAKKEEKEGKNRLFHPPDSPLSNRCQSRWQ